MGTDPSQILLTLKMQGGKAVVTQLEQTKRGVRELGTTAGNASASGLAKLDRGLGSVTRSLDKTGKVLTIGVTAPLALLGKEAISTEADFSSTMNVLQVTSGASERQVNKLRKQAVKLGQDTVYSANEAADAMLELAKGGFSPAQIAGGGAAATINLAATEGMNMADAATIMANSMNAFSIKAKYAGKIADALAGASNASTASVTSLGEGLGNVGGVARNFGLDLSQTVGILAAFDQNGIKGAEGGTALRSVLTHLVNPTKKASGLMQDLGIELTDSKGRFLSITQIADNFRKGLDGLTQSQKAQALSAIAGSYGQQGLAALMKESAKSARDADAGLAGYIKSTKEQGSAQQLANARMKGTKGALEQLSGAWDTLKLVIGQQLAPIVLTVATDLQGLIGWFTALPTGAQHTITMIGVAFALLGPAILATSFALKILRAGVIAYRAVQTFFVTWTTLSTAATYGQAGATYATVAASKSARVAMIAWTIANKALTISMLGIPLVAIVAGVALLVGGFILAYKKVGWFRSGVQATFGWIKKHWPLLLGILTGPVGLAVLIIVKHFDRIKSIASGVVDHIVSIAKRMGDLGRTIVNAVISVVNQGIGSINSLIPDKISIPMAPDINLPDNPFPTIPYLAAGGVAKAHSGGTIVKLAEAGLDEAVLRISKGAIIGGQRLSPTAPAAAPAARLSAPRAMAASPALMIPAGMLGGRREIVVKDARLHFEGGEALLDLVLDEVNTRAAFA